MKKIVFLVCISIFVHAQDVIILKNGDVIKAKVLDAAADQVKYNRYTDSTKKQYAIKNSDLRGVKYNASTYYTPESSNIIANDKIFLSNGDTLKVAIQDIWGDMIRYKSSSINNGVVYAMIKSEVLGYEQNGSKTEIEKPTEKPVVSPSYTSSSQTTRSSNSIPTSMSSYKNAEKTNKNTSFFVIGKLGGFIPVGDFGRSEELPGTPSIDPDKFPLYEGTLGYAGTGFSGGIEGAYFVNKYLGFGTELSYSVLANKIFSDAGSIPPQVTTETKPWKLFVVSPGVYGRIPIEGISFDFKLCMAAVGGVTEGYLIDDSFNFYVSNVERFSAIGVVLGTDIKVDLAENLVGTFGFDYLGTVKQKMVRLADQYDFASNELLENYPTYRDISIQGFRMNFGLGFKF